MIIVFGDIDTFVVAFFVVRGTSGFAMAFVAGFVGFAYDFAIPAVIWVALQIHALSVAIAQSAVAACFVGIGAFAIYANLVVADRIAVATM